jgi:hypothetical protein
MERDRDQWRRELRTDVGLIHYHITDHGGGTPNARSFAVALKEARRLESDLYRMARDVYGIERSDIDAIGPL